MFRNISFIGGIHGVGKSTICMHLCEILNIEHLSASSILKWSELNQDPKNKLVKNIPNTQERLVLGLNKIVQQNRYYLLDGHYCLLNSQNEIIKVPLETFKAIMPISLNLVLGEIKEIQKRLEDRDKRPYDINQLEEMQKVELNHAQYLAKELKINLSVELQADYLKLLIPLRKSFQLQ